MQHQSCGSVRLKFDRRYFVALTLGQIVLLGSPGRAFASDEQLDYLQKDYSLSCHGLETFDFILEAGQLVGEWCREQNARLGDRGCGQESDMCLEEFIRADRPGYSLSIALGAAYTKADASLSGETSFSAIRVGRARQTQIKRLCPQVIIHGPPTYHRKGCKFYLVLGWSFRLARAL